jgi:hypothetical protein
MHTAVIVCFSNIYDDCQTLNDITCRLEEESCSMHPKDANKDDESHAQTSATELRAQIDKVCQAL